MTFCADTISSCLQFSGLKNKVLSVIPSRIAMLYSKQKIQLKINKFVIGKL